ncbi:MAG: DUF1697 domain-containing protein [Candidatus Saccharimonadaceae bacterium]
MKYIALLRGINVGGKNKVSMAELRNCFEALGFKNVSTYINSGNVLFETKKSDKARLVLQCEAAIEATTGFHIVCSVISADDLRAAMEHVPKWWGVDKESTNNALFIIAPATAKQVMLEVGEAKPEYEKVEAYEPIIFWTAPLKTFSRTRYKSIVGSKTYQSVTIRNANTTRKLLELVLS